MYKQFLYILTVCLFALAMKAQSLQPFFNGHKWGYKNLSGIVIEPQYDTAFAFDKTNRIALAAIVNTLTTNTNPITGEEEFELNYFYITPQNKQLQLLPDQFPDSLSVLPDQEELVNDYQDSSGFFKILFQEKIYLFSKRGKQISGGFDNIHQTNCAAFYETELSTEYEKTIVRMKGLVDTSGKTVVKTRYHDVVVNTADSVIYCCSAIFNNKLNDDVYNYNGKLIYTNKNHIAFAGKNRYVLKTYEPKELFILELADTQKRYEYTGDDFIVLKNDKGLVIDGTNWLLIDLITGKEKKVSKDKFFQTINLITDFE